MEITDGVYSFDISRPRNLPPYTNTEAYPPFENVDEPLSIQVIDGPRTVLVDTGYAGAVHELIRALNAFDGPDAILITHGHPDHYDGLGVLSKVYAATVIAPAGDTHRIVEDVDVVPDVEIGEAFDRWGIRAIPTPGHTPGHMAFLHQPTNTLIAGDSVVHRESFVAAPGPWEGELAPCISPPVTDYAQQCDSVRYLQRHSIDRILLAHGPDVLENAGEEIELLIDQMEIE